MSIKNIAGSAIEDMVSLAYSAHRFEGRSRGEESENRHHDAEDLFPIRMAVVDGHSPVCRARKMVQ